MADLFRFNITMPGITLVATKGELRKVLRSAGAEVASRARALIRAKGPDRKKRISTPGQPPVSRTGALVSSISVRLARSGNTVTIIDTANRDGGFYARFLETGAKGGGGNVRGNTHLARTGSGKRRMNKSAISTTRVLLPHPFLSRALGEVAAAGLGERIATAIADGVKLQRAAKSAFKP